MNSKFRIIIGILIIGIGVAFMLDVMGIIAASTILSTYWPLLLILIGIFAVIDKQSSNFMGVIIVLIGLYFQLEQLKVYLMWDVDLSELIWPIIIIVIGAKILISKRH